MRSPLVNAASLALCYSIVVRSLVIAAAIALCSCGSCDHAEAPPPVSTSAEPPIPAPPNVLAEVAFSTPDDTWRAVQTMIGGPAMLAPATVGGLLVGGDPIAADKVDTRLPVFGLVVGNKDSVRFVWCAHARANSLASLKSALAESESAKFKVAASEQSIEVLEARGAGKRVIGLAHGDFVVFASSREDLVSFGPYAYRTLPTRPAQKPAMRATLGHDVLASAVHDWIADESSGVHNQLASFDEELRKDHGGRAPDFGDPRALIGVIDRWSSGTNDAVSDMDHAEVDADIDAAGVRATITLSPPKKDGAAHTLVSSMHPGDAAPLLDVSQGMILQALVRSDVDERAANAVGVANTLRAVADTKLSGADDKKLTAAMDTFSKTRGDYFILSAGFKPTVRGLSVVMHVADDTKAAQSLGVMVDQATRPPFYDPLRAALSIASNKTADKDLGVLGQGKLLTFTRDANDFFGPTLDIAYAAKSGLAGVAVGSDATALLVMATAPDHKLSEDARTKAAIDTLGRDCTIAAVLIPGLLAAQQGNDPVVVGWGKRGDDAFLSIDAATNAARQLFIQFASLGK